MTTGIEKVRLLSTSAHPDLMEEVAKILGIDHARYVTLEFANYNTLPQLLTNVEGSDIAGCTVFVFHTFAPTPNVEAEFAEFKKLLRAAHEYNAKEVIAVIGYFSYGRSHRRKPEGVPLAAKLYAEEIKNAGADRVIIIMLHNMDIIPYFGVPVIHLAAKYLIIEESKKLIGSDDAALLTPDDGRKNRLLTFGGEMRLPVICGQKERSGDGEVKFLGIDGEVKKKVLMIDDEISRADTLEKIGIYLIENYQVLEEFTAAVAHGVLCGGAIKKLSRVLDLANLKGVKFKMLFTNSLPIPATKRLPNMKIISIAPMLADVIKSLVFEEEIDPKYLY
jgi:ribose-phosphate pyrophosphokinase